MRAEGYGLPGSRRSIVAIAMCMAPFFWFFWVARMMGFRAFRA